MYAATHRQNDLYLFAKNSGEHYERRQAIEHTFARRMNRAPHATEAIYDLTSKRFGMWLMVVAHSYAHEILGKVYHPFDAEDFAAVASMFMQDTINEYELGNIAA